MIKRVFEIQGKTSQDKTTACFSFTAIKMLFIRSNCSEKLDKLIVGRFWEMRWGKGIFIFFWPKIRGKVKYCFSYLYAAERTHLRSAFVLQFYIYIMVGLSDMKIQTLTNGTSIFLHAALQILKRLLQLIHCKGCQTCFLSKQTILKLILKIYSFH